MKISLRHLVITSGSVFLLFSSFAYGSIYDVFSDVKDSSSYYYEPLYAMSKLGIITGYEDGRFGPDDSMTRAQVATILYRYNEKVVGPLVEQVVAFHDKGRSELHGASWEEYLQNYRYYHAEFTPGGEGSFGSSILLHIDDAIAGKDSVLKVVYENFSDEIYEPGGVKFGMRIMQNGDPSSDGEANFLIWENHLWLGEHVYGEFRDNVDRLIVEAKALESAPEKKESDGLWRIY